MTASSDHRARADREATNWLILLQDDPGNAEYLARFRDWLSQSELNAAAWDETQHVCAAIGATPPAHAGYWSDLPGAARVAKPPRLFARRRMIAATAAAACLVALAAPDLLLWMRSDHVTGTGELRMVRLEDGSTVHLGPGSAIDIAYAQNERRIRLLKGEAYFEVRRDPAKPFRVAAREVEATVLGTGFEMTLEDSGAGVAVRHGLVQVDYPNGAPPISERLTAGEEISLHWRGQSQKTQTRPDRIAAWTGKKLIVSNRPVREVIESLRPWYGGMILTMGAGLDTARVTGVYDLSDPAAALLALGSAHHATVRQVSPWVMVISSN